MGKPQAIFLTGEYGIGKSSLAGFMRYYAEKTNNIFGIHILLGGAETCMVFLAMADCAG